MTTQSNFSFIKLLMQWFKSIKRTSKPQSPSLKAKRQQRKDYEYLAELPDYILKDIGIKRSEINLKLNKPFWWS